MTPEQQAKSDAKHLLAQPEFLRFLWRAIQMAGIFAPSTDGSEGRHLAYDEGRRNLGLEILSMVEAGQPLQHPDHIPVLTLIQTLREEANQPQEKQNDRRNDRYHELRDDDGSDD